MTNPNEKQPDNADDTSQIHPNNRHLVGVHDPVMLRQCGGVAFDKLNAVTRIAFDSNFRKFGNIHGRTAGTDAVSQPSSQPAARRGVEDLDSVRLPPAARGFQGAARIDAARRVASANAARAELAAIERGEKRADANRLYQLTETITHGWGGSPA